MKPYGFTITLALLPEITMPSAYHIQNCVTYYFMSIYGGSMDLFLTISNPSKQILKKKKKKSTKEGKS